MKHTKKTILERRAEIEKINPDYYTKGIETIDYIISHSMNYLEGNLVKYVTRYKHKNGLEDLLKAKWYLDRLIKNYNEKGVKDETR
tara:strand:+ start:32 stop:289 length:258 start_codon:yes stop_codon:yes gene_type:complete